MPTHDFAAVSPILASLFYDRVTQNINRSIVLPQLLDMRAGTGKNIQWDAQLGVAAPATAVIADGADVTIFNDDTIKPAVLQYGTYHDAFAVTGKAMAAARETGNPMELAGLFLDKMEDSAMRLAKAVTADIYAGAGGNAMVGLTAAAGGIDSTGVYATIDRAVDTQWASTELDGVTVGLAGNGVRNALRDLRTSIYKASGLKNDLFVCDPDTHAKLGKEYDTERRWMDQIRLARGPMTLAGGYNVLEFDGIPVIEDNDCPANTLLAINTQETYLAHLPDQVTEFNNRLFMVPLVGTPEEQFGAGRVPMQAAVVHLANAGDAHKYMLVVWPSVVVRRPNSCGKIIQTDLL